MRRLFWIGVGVAAGVVVVTKGRAYLRRYTPEGVTENVERAAAQVTRDVRQAAQTFREAAQRRQEELTAMLLGERDPDEAREQWARARGGRGDADSSHAEDGPSVDPARSHQSSSRARQRLAEAEALEDDAAGESPYSFF